MIELSDENPLAIADRGKRLTACYIAKGFTRVAFARALRCAPSTLYRWEHGMGPTDIEDYIRASDVLGYTIDELARGIRAGAVDVQLTDDEIDQALAQLRADTAQRRAFSEIERERMPGGRLRWVPITSTFIARVCETYARHRQLGHDQAVAIAFDVATGVHLEMAAL